MSENPDFDAALEQRSHELVIDTGRNCGCAYQISVIFANLWKPRPNQLAISG